ncbi:leukocyte receptor cluster member 1 homolog [Teleopsis dalmanni]|uniref:leukocyte receptor cluster member 1 homolog n=1 Tax=Teleopsis dalmanni TaxID=139649 RepID=UPI0018CF54C6|nr:leukocyte receptor cluster member 1 homolog [Teleopsis dalmanni]XP_037945590.1 leukocyte receptor cluster member 1 homolog [Teleopsis dalmanni]XP_037945591.1 leukocyte receptor cluster member 1 homolog [Teleopsis dalmanni]
MNILPKKSWHVRNKDNIARVRRDEAEAREQEEVKKKKFELAENEARISFLRKKSGLVDLEEFKKTYEIDEDTPTSSQHVNLFSDLNSHTKSKNKEAEKESKAEREKYEKQVGYLTYLGQDTNEALKLKSWYEKAPIRGVETKYDEKDLRNKYYNDPLTLIKTLLPSEQQSDEETDSEKEKEKAPSNDKIKTEILTKDLEFNRKSKKSKEKKEKKSKKKHKKKSKYNSEKELKHKNREELSIERMQDKKEKLAKLREERLRREAAEKLRQEALMAPKTDVPPVNTTNVKPSNTRIKQKYNSQFNPELAKQNILENN